MPDEIDLSPEQDESLEAAWEKLSARWHGQKPRLLPRIALRSDGELVGGDGNGNGGDGEVPFADQPGMLEALQDYARRRRPLPLAGDTVTFAARRVRVSLPKPYEEGKHPRGYHGRWRDANAAHQQAEEVLKAHEKALARSAEKIDKLKEVHEKAKAAHAAAKKTSRAAAPTPAGFETHKAQIAAIIAKGQLATAKAAHAALRKVHTAAKKAHTATKRELNTATKEKAKAEKATKPATKVRPKAKATAKEKPVQAPAKRPTPETPPAVPPAPSPPPTASTAPAPAPAPVSLKVKADPNLSPAARTALKGIASGIAANRGLSREQRVEFFQASQRVIGKMTPTALERFRAGANGGVHFASSWDDMRVQATGWVFSDTAKRDSELAQLRGMNAAGIFGRRLSKAGVTEGAVFVDGGRMNVVGGHTAVATAGGAHQIYAHEFAHALDGTSWSLISNRPPWQAAWSEELAAGQLTAYGGTQADEGWAEFGRLVLGGDNDLAAVARAYPKCWAVWQAHGLVEALPGSRQAGFAEESGDRPPVILPEIFGQRVPLGDDEASHADCWLEAPEVRPASFALREDGVLLMGEAEFDDSVTSLERLQEYARRRMPLPLAGDTVTFAARVRIRLPQPYEEGKHPRGYHGRWRDANAAHQQAEKVLKAHERALGKSAEKIDKLKERHEEAKAAHAAARKTSRAAAPTPAGFITHKAEIAAIIAKGQWETAKAAHAALRKVHTAAKKAHTATKRELAAATKEKAKAEKTTKPATRARPKAKAAAKEKPEVKAKPEAKTKPEVKATAKAKPAAPAGKPKPPEPRFTGKDPTGHCWQSGRMVPCPDTAEGTLATLKGTDGDLSDAYREASKREPGLGIGAFHDRLRALEAQGVVKPIYDKGLSVDLEDPETALWDSAKRQVIVGFEPTGKKPTGSLPEPVDQAAVVDAVRQAVAAHATSGDPGDLPIGDLHAQVDRVLPNVATGQVHDAIRQLRKAGDLLFTNWGGLPMDVPAGLEPFFVGHKLMAYVHGTRPLQAAVNAGKPAPAATPLPAARNAAEAVTEGARAVAALGFPDVAKSVERATTFPEKLYDLAMLDTRVFDPILRDPALAARGKAAAKGFLHNEFLRTLSAAYEEWQRSPKDAGQRNHTAHRLEGARADILERAVPALRALGQDPIADFYATHGVRLADQLVDEIRRHPDEPPDEPPPTPLAPAPRRGWRFW